MLEANILRNTEATEAAHAAAAAAVAARGPCPYSSAPLCAPLEADHCVQLDLIVLLLYHASKVLPEDCDGKDMHKACAPQLLQILSAACNAPSNFHVVTRAAHVQKTAFYKIVKTAVTTHLQASAKQAPTPFPTLVTTYLQLPMYPTPPISGQTLSLLRTAHTGFAMYAWASETGAPRGSPLGPRWWAPPPSHCSRQTPTLPHQSTWRGAARLCR